MNVQVKHNSVNITGWVTAYDREHKICTGIGTLKVILSKTTSRTFEPWDSIDIHENGSFQVRYYISSVSINEPTGEITLECQDISKRLVDYFIPDSYTIDYPSYTRYWIEKFLTEAGVDVIFTTALPGNLISNYTQLGLVSAYEQIITLLQMSGWFMYFDGNQKAVVGPLDVNLASLSGSVGKTDILEINRISDDRMLRNRAIVLGAYDPYDLTYASAEVTVHTPWNYDHRDLRTVVISNSNIPNKGSAYLMANQIIKEFARITVEKHITVWGAREYGLGTALRVTTNVWKGRGLITTFGVSMSKQGLVTKLILDERCPRLFGFFDFGDYVYVATFGDGVWRKHIKFDPAWYNFSTGLTNLNITDMHINDGVFGSVGASGELYYAIDDLPWNNIPLSGLMSSVEDIVTTSGEVQMQLFSGLKGRAIIVDKLGNVVRYGIDTASGINYGDYFLSSGWTTPVGSGVSSSGGHRGWIVEYDVLGGDLTGTPYPISVSGNYNVTVIDLENDGKNDYVSVRMGGDGITGVGFEYNYGYGNRHEYPLTSKRSYSTLTGSVNALTPTQNSFFSFGAIDNVSDHELFWTTSTTFRIRKYTKDENGFTQVSNTIVSLPSEITPLGQNSEQNAAILRPNPGVYKFAAHGDTVTYNRVCVVTITHQGSEVYSVTVSNVLNDNTATITAQNGQYCALGGVDNSTFDRKIKAGVLDIIGQTASFGEVWASGGTGTDRKEPLVRTWILNGHLEAVGFQLEWNTGTPTNKSLYNLYLSGSTLTKGSAVATGDIPTNWTISAQQLSRIYMGVYTNVLSTWYIAYNTGLTGTMPDAAQGWHPVLNSAFDGTVIRINPSTQRLEYSGIPISTWISVDFGDEEPVTGVFSYPDTITGYIYLRTQSISTSAHHISAIDWSSKTIKSMFTRFTDSSPADPNIYHVYDIGDMVIVIDTQNHDLRGYLLKNPNPATGVAPRYLVLQREGTDFNIVQEEIYPIRVDISNDAPLVTVGSGEQSFESYFIYDSEVTLVDPTLAGTRPVEDYRYTFLEPIASGITASGLPVQSQILYIAGSGIYGADSLTYSGGFNIMFGVPSGYGTRIETSNYGLGGQYIFITASGNTQEFWQMNPGEYSFAAYSGMPQSRATIIRLDDAI